MLATKRPLPGPVPSMLDRPRLLELLQEDLERPLTLIAAAAGSGKTTLTDRRDCVSRARELRLLSLGLSER